MEKKQEEILVTSTEQVVELMQNGFHLKHFKGEEADYWGLLNDVMNNYPHIVRLEEQHVPHDKLVVLKRITLESWPWPGKRPVVTTYKLKEF